MDKEVDHVLKIGAFTKSNLGYPLAKNKSLRGEVTRLLTRWNLNQKSFQTVRTPILYTTLKRTATNKKLPSITTHERALKTFQYYPSTSVPLEVRDIHGHLLAYRFPLPLHLVDTLEENDKLLPNVKTSNAGRGTFSHRHYAAWGDYKKEVYHSSEYLRDRPRSDQWLAANHQLFKHLSNTLRMLDPQMFIATTNFPHLKCPPLAGAWHGVAINQGMTSENGGDVHQDWQDSHKVLNCAVPYGTWTGGDVALWQLKMKIQVQRGEALMFLGSVIAHGACKVETGERNVIDLFTHKSSFDDKKRIYTDRQIEDQYPKKKRKTTR